MFELMNEPVQIETTFGANNWGSGSGSYFQAFRNFTQPIINAIRNTGADNVIWVPTLGWQGEPHGWAQYPFTGSNIGVAAHYYPAYGGVHNNATAVQNLWNSNYKPAADRWPMMITECMWFPNPAGGYDDLFNGTTAGFGNALKNAMDNQGNVSFLVGFLADCLVNLVNSTPANCTLGSNEGTQTYFDWLPTYAWAAPGGGPSGLTASALSATEILLTWNPFIGATNYTVKRSASSGGPYATVAGVTTTNYTDTVTAGMRFYYVVSAMVDGLGTPNSSEASVNLPYPWITQDIGSVGLAGSASFSNGVFTVNGGGDDIWNTADAFRFIYVPVTGNCTITARVVSIQNTDPWAKAGVMIRSNLNANSAHAFISVTPSNGVAFQYRSSTGGTSVNNNTTGFSAPYWVRLVRSGNTFTGYRSPNGVTWTQQGSATTISMTSTVYAGLAVTAHNNSALCTATFDNVTLPGWANWTLPPVPGGLAGSAANGQAALTWQASSTATSYNVKRSTTNGGPYTIAANVTATNYTDTGLTNGTLYYYVVSAMNPAGESANSVQLALAPRPPLSLTLTTTNLTLSWPLASAGFTVQSCTNLVSGNWTDVTSLAPEIVGDQWRVTLPPATNGAAFYRLVK